MSNPIQEFINTANSQFGKNAVTIDDDEYLKTEFIPTGIVGLDKSLGGGFPRGRMTEILGRVGVGKTTITLHAIKQAQERGINTLFVDMEHAFNPERARQIGVGVDNLVVSRPEDGEKALEITEMAIQTGEFGMVIIDSIAAMTPSTEMEKGYGDSVSFDTPIITRDKRTKEIDIVSIDSLYKGSRCFNGKRHSNSYKKTKRIEVMTHLGWQQLNRVFYKRNKDNKKLIITNTLSGSVTTTPDHCLFANSREVTPKELGVGDKLDVVNEITTPRVGFLPNDVAWFLGYFCAEGSQENLTTISVCDTNPEFLQKAGRIVKEYFCVKTKNTTNLGVGKRSDLHILTITASQQLNQLTKDCFDATKQKKVPKVILNDPKTYKAFLEGFRDGDGVVGQNKLQLYSSSQILMAGLVFIFNQMGKKYSLSCLYRGGNKSPEYTLSESIKNAFPKNEIRRFIELPAPERLYDLETEAGTFVGGVGNIILHNSVMGLHSRLMSQACRKLVGLVFRKNVALVFINQYRTAFNHYGGSDIGTGGAGVGFYSSVRLDVKRIGRVEDSKKNWLADKIKVTTIKNKMNTPMQITELVLGKTGVDVESMLIDELLKSKVLSKSGAFIKLGEEVLAQGKMALAEKIRGNEELRSRLEKLIDKQGQITT